MSLNVPRLQHLIQSCETDADRKGLIKVLTDGSCEYPGCTKPGKLTAQNTAYAKDLSNWHRLCDDCQKEADEYWTSMWQEYYSSVL